MGEPKSGVVGEVVDLEKARSEKRIRASLPFNIIGVERLFSPLLPLEWLCQSLRIAAGAPTLFAGYGYSGKSVALQSLAVSVAACAPIWGGMTCRSGPVLHLDYEQGFRITAERYQRLAHAMGLHARQLEGRLECGILPSEPLSRDALLWMGEERALVVIDSWRASHPNVDENSSEVRKTLDAMGVASERTGCVFIVLVHARKPNKDSFGGSKMAIRGSSGFFDGAQTVFIFDGEKVGCPTVTLEKDRLGGADIAPFSLVIEDTDGGAGLSVLRQAASEPAPAPTGEEKFADLCRLILAAVEASPGTSASTLAEVLEKRKASVVAAVQSLVAAGQLIQSGEGKFTKLYRKEHVTNGAPF